MRKILAFSMIALLGLLGCSRSQGQTSGPNYNAARAGMTGGDIKAMFGEPVEVLSVSKNEGGGEQWLYGRNAVSGQSENEYWDSYTGSFSMAIWVLESKVVEIRRDVFVKVTHIHGK